MNNAHQRLVATVKLGHVIANMRAAMYRTGRGFRSFQTKRIPYESTRDRRFDTIPSLKRFRQVTK